MFNTIIYSLYKYNNTNSLLIIIIVINFLYLDKKYNREKIILC